jgi:hypothetical protein
MMNTLPDIIRDQNGYFHHRNGVPLVVIFDSKNPQDKPPDEISWQEPVIASGATELKESGENSSSHYLSWYLFSKA